MSKSPESRTTARQRKRAARLQAITDHLAHNDTEQDRTEALQTARAIALAGLPKKKTTGQNLIRTLRLGTRQWLQVIYTADPKGILPYGQDRFVLAGIQSLALEQQSPVVYFEQVSELLKMFGLSTDGRSLRRLRERFKRLAGLSIRLRFAETEQGLNDPPSGESIFIIKSFSLPTRKELRDELRAMSIRRHQLLLPGLEGTPPSQYGVLLSADFWQHLKEPKNHLILPMDLMRLFINQPTGWDYAAFLVYRCSRAKTTSVVSHDVLMSLFKDSEQEPDKKAVYRLLKYHEEIMRPYGNRLNATLEQVGTLRTGKRGRPKERWQLRVGPSKQIIWSGKKDELHSISED